MDSTRRHLLMGSASGLGLAGFGMASFPALAQKAVPGQRKIVLGQSAPLTGAANEIGLAYAAGTKLYFDAFNARTPPPAWRFEVKLLDDGYDAAKAGANAKKLLADGVDLLYGFVGTSSSEAGAKEATAAGALFYAPFAASDALRDSSATNVFNVRPSMADEAFKMVRHCATLNQTRIAVMAEDDAMGRAVLAAVNNAITELKLPALVGSAFVPVNSTTPDKVDAAVKALNKVTPQAIIQGSLFSSTATFIRAMRKTGYAGAFMNFSVVGIDPLFTALGKEIGGVVVSQVVPSPRSAATPIVKEYLAAIDTSDQTPSYESMEGFIAAKTLAEAVKRAGKGFTTATLQQALAGMTNYDVGGFRINLRAGVRDSIRAIDLVTITPDGKVIR